jgi:CRISPR/Cas system-associated protein Cas10 (large subunit of type III CRISPR-Cas system)
LGGLLNKKRGKMSKDVFFDKVMKLWEDKNLDAEEFCYELGKVVKEYEAAQQKRSADATTCPVCGRVPNTKNLCQYCDALFPLRS